MLYRFYGLSLIKSYILAAVILWELLGEEAVRFLGELVLLGYFKSSNSSWTQLFFW